MFYYDIIRVEVYGMVVLEELGKFGEIIANFNYDNFKKLMVDRITEWYIKPFKSGKDHYEELIKENGSSFQALEFVKNYDRAIKSYEEILNNEELLEAYVKLKLTETVDFCIHDLYNSRTNNRLNPSKDIVIRCLDGYSYSFSGEEKNKLLDVNLEEIRRVIYETAGLQYTSSQEILTTTDESVKRQLLYDNNMSIDSDGRCVLGSIRFVDIDSNPEQELQRMMERRNITSLSSGAPRL